MGAYGRRVISVSYTHLDVYKRQDLSDMGVLIPTEYKRSCGINYNNGFRAGKNPKWDAGTVLRILKNELYTCLLYTS